jgi:hypothetical protein
MWENMVELDRPDGKIVRRMRFAYWITKAIGMHSEYVILIAFQGKNYFRE